MVAFEIAVDGQKVCTAGVGDAGVLSAVASWVRRPSIDKATGAEIAGRYDEEFELEVGGLLRDPDGAGVNLTWLSRALSVGQQVTLTVVDATEIDPPKTRTRQDPARDEQRKRDYYERLKREFGDA